MKIEIIGKNKELYHELKLNPELKWKMLGVIQTEQKQVSKKISELKLILKELKK